MEIKQHITKWQNRFVRQIDKVKEVANETKRIRVYQESAEQQLILLDYWKQKKEGSVYPLDRIVRLNEEVVRLEDMFWEMGYKADIQVRVDEGKLKLGIYTTI